MVTDASPKRPFAAPHEDIARKDDLGGYVGWVERGGRRWIFALNMDLPRGIDDAPKRISTPRALLTQTGTLPPGS
jgi:beta-lactamase class D